MVQTILKGTSAGVLFLLPPTVDNSFVLKTQSALAELEAHLLASTVEFPLYFAVEDEKLTNIYNSLKGSRRQFSSETYTVLVSEKDAEQVPKYQVHSLQGTLTGSGDDAPTLAIVTHFDTLGIAPGFTKGSNANGSGVAALLELVRLFSKLYNSTKTRPQHNLVFVLSSGGRLNYLGTRQWLQKAPAILGNMEFALCLEGIAGPKLNLHVSRKPKDDHVKHLYQIFTDTAAQAGLPFEIIHKKINVSHSEMAWEHEAFSYKKIPAATLSSAPAPTPLLTRTSLLDNSYHLPTLERNIGFVVDVLLQYLYPTVQNASLAGAAAISSKHVASWMTFFGANPRPDPFVSDDPKAKVPTGLTTAVPALLAKALQQHLGSEVQHFRETEASTKAGPVLYTNVVSSMQVFTSKPLLFDLLLFVPIAAYLLALNVYFKGLSDVRLLYKLAAEKLGLGQAAGNRRKQ